MIVNIQLQLKIINQVCFWHIVIIVVYFGQGTKSMRPFLTFQLLCEKKSTNISMKPLLVHEELVL